MMKKTVFALAALSVVALIGMTSCKKDYSVKTSLYDEVLELGKYVGVKATDAKTALTGAGWTYALKDTADSYSKTINGCSVESVVLKSQDNYIGFEVIIYDAKCYENARTMMNKVAREYKFETLGVTAPFYEFTGIKSEVQKESSTMYDSAMYMLNNESYVDIETEWIDANTGNELEIKTDTQSSTIDVEIGKIED